MTPVSEALVSEERLEPCPFCGAAFKIAQEPDDNHPVAGKFYIYHDYGPLGSSARSCPVEVSRHFDSREEAIAAWNRRSAPALSQDEGAVLTAWRAAVLSRIAVFSEMEPEEDESWDSWYRAAFDMLHDEVRTGNNLHLEQVAPAALSMRKPSEAEVEAALLTEFAKHTGWELDRGYEDRTDDEDSPYGWRVFERSGNANDREWRLIGFSLDSPHAAIRAALQAAQEVGK